MVIFGHLENINEAQLNFLLQSSRWALVKHDPLFRLRNCCALQQHLVSEIVHFVVETVILTGIKYFRPESFQ